MTNWGPVSFDFYSIGSLLGVIFCFFNAQLFLTVKEKSRATYYLGMATFWLGMFHFAYLVNFSLLGPSAAYLRWLVMPSAMLGSLYLFSFFLSYPEEYYPKARIIMHRILQTSVGLVVAYFMFISISAGRVYYFSGHYWDFPLPSFYRFYAIVVLTFFVIFISGGIFQAIKAPKEYRFAHLGILFSFAVLTVIPGLLNAQSRDGAVERGIYQTVTDLLLVIGLFASTVLYINNTKDKTTILSRIIGITLATFLLILQMVAYFTVQQAEVSFDRISFQEAKHAVLAPEEHKSISFFYSYDLCTGEGKALRDAEGKTNDPETYLPEFWNAWFYANAIALPGENDVYTKPFLELVSKLPESSSGYAKDFERAVSEEQIKDKNSFANYVKETKRKILFTRNKWNELPLSDLETKGAKLFGIQKGNLSSFHEVAKGLIAKNLPPEDKKKAISDLLSPMSAPGERSYRGQTVFAEKTPDRHFYVSYFVIDPSSMVVAEIGTPYEDYRAFIQEASLPWMISGLAVVFIVIFGFRVFFWGALIKPMQDVIQGLTEVNSGNLDARLTIRVEDEIGFMARSFNRMVRSILAARKKLEEYADQLEEKVKERTKELEFSLKEVNDLKHQQDGDYFLTSLLLQPFNNNRATSKSVNVDFLIEQKKKFTFRQHTKEIGGDLNIANQIELNNKSYTVFLNADAMGKSIQGAGGALVLGSVFESIITRTRLSNEAQKMYPERWIKNTFIELHKVFEGFDGSMLVSLVLGLVDNETGLLYYINAEHPWMVLYRDGIASFIEKELLFRKLGTSGVQGEISIQTFQLEPGDVIIAGSDGRDDLLISKGDDGKRNINEDEMLFLKIVERGEADLEKIYGKLHEIGGLTDDLSLIRVSFAEVNQKATIENEKLNEIKALIAKAKEASESEETQEALIYLEKARSLDQNIPEVKKKFIQMYLKLKDYSSAKTLAKEYSDRRPVDTEIMYVTAYCARKTSDLKTAIDFGERVKLRDPSHVKNLVNLGQSYLSLRNFKRSESILKNAIALDPTNANIIRLLDHVRKKIEKEQTRPLALN